MTNSNPFIAGLVAQRLNLIEQLEHINAMLKLNGVDLDANEPNIDSEKPVGDCPYKKGGSYKEKLAALLKHAGRFLSINEMASLIKAYEPKVELEDAKKGLQSAKNLMLKEGSITKYQFGTNNSNTFYGGTAWLGDDNKPKPQFMYDETALVKKEVIEI